MNLIIREHQLDNNASTLALIAIVGTVITALFKLLRDNTKALVQLVESNNNIAKATNQGNNEAKQRNGHLGEQNVQIAQLVTQQGADIAAIKASTQNLPSININTKEV